MLTLHLSNVTTQTVVVPPHAVLCELQPVTITEGSGEEASVRESYMDKLKISSDILTAQEIRQLEDLLRDRPENFASSDIDVGHTSRVKHPIHVTNDIPFKERHRYIPPGMYQQL